MHFRRLAALTLGAWLGGSLLVAFFAMQNARITEQIMRTPAREALGVMVRIQESDLRMLLDYHASEGSYWLRSNWEIAQLVLGSVTLVALFLGGGGSRYPIVFCVLMIATAAFLHFFLTPQIQRLTVTVDFLQADQVSVARDRLRSLQTGYTVAENVKLVLALVTAYGLLRRVRRSRRETSVN